MGIEIGLEINKAYLPYLQASTPRTQIFFGGSSSGKSMFLAQRTLIDVINGSYNYLIVRKVARTIRASVFNEIVKLINEHDLNKIFNINKSDLVITCKNGYQILFVGLDDVEKLKSITPLKGVIGTIWIEEATETADDDIKQLQKRLRGISKTNKRIVMSFNPILKSHWLYQEYFKNWSDSETSYKDNEVSILKTTYKDNAFLMEDDIRNLEDETDKYYYDVYTLGNWGVLGNLIFKNWEVKDLTKETVIVGDKEVSIMNTFDNYKNGQDFGFSSDPAATVRTHYDKKNKTIYVIDELYEREMTNDVLAKNLKTMIGNEYIVCDSAEPKSITELRLLGIKALGAKKGKDSIDFGIDWLQRQKIIIHTKCQNFKNEIAQFKWKEDKDGNVLKVPIDKNNHLIDALRYCYEDEMTYRQMTAVKGF
jgi:phage terminase large subunit